MIITAAEKGTISYSGWSRDFPHNADSNVRMTVFGLFHRMMVNLKYPIGIRLYFFI